MAAGRDPVDRVIDLVIAVPVSIVAAARQLMPVRVTRVEQFVARDLDLIVRYARRARPPMQRRVRGATRPEPVARVEPPPPEHGVPVVDVSPAAPPRPSVSSAMELPIEGYDQLSARQIVDRLGALTGPELALVEQHEQQHRRRQTILLRIAQLT